MEKNEKLPLAEEYGIVVCNKFIKKKFWWERSFCKLSQTDKKEMIIKPTKHPRETVNQIRNDLNSINNVCDDTIIYSLQRTNLSGRNAIRKHTFTAKQTKM